jgi:two-component sensor histidine kinase
MNAHRFVGLDEPRVLQAQEGICARCFEREHVELQVRETYHRIANALQLTSSLMRLQALGAASEEARSELRSAHQRVESIAIVHRLLCDNGQELVDLEDYLQTLIDGICGIWERPSCRTRLSILAPSSSMGAERATCIGMIVNELVCNAYKYAFPDGRSGEVHVCLGTAGSLFVLEVVDDGIGFEGSEIAFRNGLGLRMVDAMARRLRGSYHREYVTRGAKSVVCFPRAYPLEGSGMAKG